MADSSANRQSAHSPIVRPVCCTLRLASTSDKTQSIDTSSNTENTAAVVDQSHLSHRPRRLSTQWMAIRLPLHSITRVQATRVASILVRSCPRHRPPVAPAVRRLSSMSVASSTATPSVVFVTGNANKLAEVKDILADVIPNLQSISIDGQSTASLHTHKSPLSRCVGARLTVVVVFVPVCWLAVPELQGADALTITRAKAIYARQQSPYPVLVEDTSLCFNALNSLPGPYIKWHHNTLTQHTHTACSRTHTTPC